MTSRFYTFYDLSRNEITVDLAEVTSIIIPSVLASSPAVLTIGPGALQTDRDTAIKVKNAWLDFNGVSRNDEGIVKAMFRSENE